MATMINTAERLTTEISTTRSLPSWGQAGPFRSRTEVTSRYGILPTQNLRNVRVDAQQLTDREREVLSLVAEGNTNKVIGAHLVIAERTVKSHLTNIMTKLRASDRTHAVVTALRLGWLVI